MSLNVPEGMIYMYDVTIVPPWNRVYKRSDKKVCRRNYFLLYLG